jgi:hypothetical protein
MPALPGPVRNSAVTEPPYGNVYPDGSGIHWPWNKAVQAGFFLAAELVAVSGEAD